MTTHAQQDFMCLKTNKEINWFSDLGVKYELDCRPLHLIYHASDK